MKEIKLDWPPKELTSNRTKGKHWSAISGLRKVQKSASYYLAKSCPRPPIQINYHIELIFHPPAKYKYDLDNLLSGMKGALDGVALAWGVDDYQFRPITIDFGDVIENGCVMLGVKYDV